MRFAENTSVSVEKSKAEIERILLRYGASGFGSLWSGSKAVIMFEMRGKRIKFELPLPDRQDEKFWRTPTRNIRRSQEDAHKEWEQSCRQLWRALALTVKAKLEAVESGISIFEEEFMAHIVMPDGKTVGDHVLPWISVGYEKKQLPALPGW